MSRISVVVPVKDGARYLGELLDALAREAPDEVLVIDSGSADDSPAIARAGGARVLEIAPEEFGHGRTRNLGAESTAGGPEWPPLKFWAPPLSPSIAVRAVRDSRRTT